MAFGWGCFAAGIFDALTIDWAVPFSIGHGERHLLIRNSMKHSTHGKKQETLFAAHVRPRRRQEFFQHRACRGWQANRLLHVRDTIFHGTWESNDEPRFSFAGLVRPGSRGKCSLSIPQPSAVSAPPGVPREQTRTRHSYLMLSRGGPASRTQSRVVPEFRGTGSFSGADYRKLGLIHVSHAHRTRGLRGIMISQKLLFALGPPFSKHFVSLHDLRR